MITTMRTKGRRTGLAVLVTSALASAAALAAEPQTEEQIVVQAERLTSKVVGRTRTSGVPIVQYEIRYRVSYADLDLATNSGAEALKRRVREAAQSVCTDLDKLYPLVEPDRSCARTVEDSAAPNINAAIAASQNRVTE